LRLTRIEGKELKDGASKYSLPGIKILIKEAIIPDMTAAKLLLVIHPI
jgi:hypothetical protein